MALYISFFKSLSPVSPRPVIKTTGIFFFKSSTIMEIALLSIFLDFFSVKVPSISKQTALYFCSSDFLKL